MDFKKLDDMIFEIKSTYINDHGLVHREIEEATGFDFVTLKLNRPVNIYRRKKPFIFKKCWRYCRFLELSNCTILDT